MKSSKRPIVDIVYVTIETRQNVLYSITHIPSVLTAYCSLMLHVEITERGLWQELAMHEYYLCHTNSLQVCCTFSPRWLGSSHLILARGGGVKFGHNSKTNVICPVVHAKKINPSFERINKFNTLPPSADPKKSQSLSWVKTKNPPSPQFSNPSLSVLNGYSISLKLCYKEPPLQSVDYTIHMQKNSENIFLTLGHLLYEGLPISTSYLQTLGHMLYRSFLISTSYLQALGQLLYKGLPISTSYLQTLGHMLYKILLISTSYCQALGQLLYKGLPYLLHLTFYISPVVKRLSISTSYLQTLSPPVVQRFAYFYILLSDFGAPVVQRFAYFYILLSDFGVPGVQKFACFYILPPNFAAPVVKRFAYFYILPPDFGPPVVQSFACFYILPSDFGAPVVKRFAYFPLSTFRH